MSTSPTPSTPLTSPTSPTTSTMSKRKLLHLDFDQKRTKIVDKVDDKNEVYKLLDDIQVNLTDPQHYLDEHFYALQREIDLKINAFIDKNSEYALAYEDMTLQLSQLRDRAMKNWQYFEQFFNKMRRKYSNLDLRFVFGKQPQIESDRDKIRRAILNVSTYSRIEDFDEEVIGDYFQRSRFTYFLFAFPEHVRVIDEVDFITLCVLDVDLNSTVNITFDELEFVYVPEIIKTLVLTSYVGNDRKNTIQGLQSNTLDTIQLFHSNIDHLDFSMILPKLKEFYADNVSFSSISPSFFSHCVGLQILKIEQASLRILPENVFDELTQLRVLKITHTKIAKLPEKLFKNLNNLTVLSLEDNPNLLNLPRVEDFTVKKFKIHNTKIKKIKYFDQDDFIIFADFSYLDLNDFKSTCSISSNLINDAIMRYTVKQKDLDKM